MSDQTALLNWVHRKNIERCRRIMGTDLTPIERQFVERRIHEEQAALRDAGALVDFMEVCNAEVGLR